MGRAAGSDRPRPSLPCSSAACERIRGRGCTTSRTHESSSTMVANHSHRPSPRLMQRRTKPVRVRDRLGWIVAAALALTLGGTMLLNRREMPPVGARAGRVSNSRSRGLELHETGGRFRGLSRRPTRRLRREFESRVVALGAIVGRGRSTAASWHGWRAQSILEPGQPVDRFLCGQSVENGACERGGSGRAVDMVRVHARELGESRVRPNWDLEQPEHRRLRAVQRRQPVSNQREARRNGDAGHDA